MSQYLLSRSPYRQEFASSNARSYRRLRVTPMKWKLVFGPMTLIVALVFVAIAMSMLYLAHFNQVATKGYDLKRLEVDRQQLMDEYQVRMTRVAQAKSLDTITSTPRIQRMVKARDISFVRGDTAVASATVGF